MNITYKIAFRKAGSQPGVSKSQTLGCGAELIIVRRTGCLALR
jgi:hypothetical protein